jgi:uncharacterized membrane protein
MTHGPVGSAAKSEGELPLGRLEAFSDGVFAIAITLLVLELGVPTLTAGENLLAAIVAQWPAILAYVTSFLTIGAVWIAHSTLTSALRAADGTLYRLNLLVLLVTSFLPFPTKLITQFTDNPDAERVATVFYGLVLLALSLSMTVFVRYAFEQRRLIKDHIDDETVDAVGRRGPGYVVYVVAITTAWVAPQAASVLYLAAAVYLTIPARTIRRLLRRYRPA